MASSSAPAFSAPAALSAQAVLSVVEDPAEGDATLTESGPDDSGRRESGEQPTDPSRTPLSVFGGMIRTMRPHQWVKNLFVLAPVVFAKNLNPSVIQGALGAFGIFCLLAGAIYTLNDVLDVDADRVHPVKRHRPIASGVVPVRAAWGLVVALLLVCTAGALLGPWQFGLTAASYFVLNTAYSLRLKKIAYVDAGCIATGFVFRVLAGGFATHTPVSGYMVACTAFLALFLAFGKRRHELSSANAAKQRAALKAYSERALFWALAITGGAAVATYLGYTLDQDIRRFFRSEWLWLTTIHPLAGVLRFLQLVRGRPNAESPTQEMLKDTPFVLNVVVWIIEVVVIVYHLRPT